MAEYEDFQEIGNCGGKATFHFVCDAQGRLSLSQGFSHSSPGPAAWVGIYAHGATGQVVSDFRMGGMGQSFEPQPPPGCFSVFLGSDSRMCWGHQCPRCQGYFRNGNHPNRFPLTCPYCGLKTGAFRFLTEAQKAYVKHYIETLTDGLAQEIAPGTEREIVIDLDEIAKKTDEPKPDFYHTSETQQTRYKCEECNDFNDIRGVYGYCASCGWRNNAQSLRASFTAMRQKLNDGHLDAASVVTSSVSEYDACCRDLVAQVRKHVAMKPARRAVLDRPIFHELNSATISLLRTGFEIDVLRGMESEIAHLTMMLHRRHILVHNAGVADERYVRESGDTETVMGVLIRETPNNAHRLVGNLMRIVENFEKDFHEIFEPTAWPRDYFKSQQAQRAAREAKPRRNA